MSQRARLVLLGVFAAAGACGCAGGLHSDAKATQVYVLRAVARPLAEPTQPPASVSVRVGRPVASPGLESDHIVLVQSDHRMSYYVASRWAADLPAVVEVLAVDTLQSTGGWVTVQSSSSAFSAEYLLQIMIRRFEADYSADPQAPEVHVVFDCTVGKRAGREIVASFTAEGTARAAANRLGDVVAAFEAASNQALSTVATQASQAVRMLPAESER